jgi:FixJ family two-component response regulator
MNEISPIVFVIDDEPSVRASLKRLIGSVGLQVQTFSSAKEFLKIKRSDGPACLVLDVRLPDLSGLELQQELTTAKESLPIVFITGPRGYPDVGSRYESRRDRISYQAIQRAGPSRGYPPGN